MLIMLKYALIFYSFYSPFVLSEDIYLDYTFEAYSGPFSVYDATSNQNRSYNHKDFMYLFSRAESGLKSGNSYYSFIHRYDAYIDVSKGTSELIYINNTNTFKKNKSFPIYLKVNQIESWGFKLGHSFKFNETTDMNISLQLLNATSMIDGKIQGEIETFDEEYQGQLNMVYAYTKDPIWDRSVDSKTGLGFAVDIEFSWVLTNDHSFNFEFFDVFNAIYWEDMYYTTADMTTNRVTYDDNGKLDVRSALRGFEGNKDYTQRLPLKSSLKWLYSFSKKHKIESELFILDRYTDIRIRYSPDILQGMFMYMSSHQAFGLGYKGDNFQLFIASDNLQYKDAHSLAAKIAWQFTF
jgi:hypothetical protein